MRLVEKEGGEFVSSSGFCPGVKGRVNKLCDELKDQVSKTKSEELPSVPCPPGESCQDKKPIETFQAVNETLTFKVKTCTVTIRLTGSFVGKGEIGTCKGCK